MILPNHIEASSDALDLDFAAGHGERTANRTVGGELGYQRTGSPEHGAAGDRIVLPGAQRRAITIRPRDHFTWPESEASSVNTEVHENAAA